MSFCAAGYAVCAQQQLQPGKIENQAGLIPVVHVDASLSAASQTLMPQTFSPGGCATNTSNIVYYSLPQYTATPTYTVNSKGYFYGTNLTYLTRGGTTYTISANKAAQKYFVAGTATISSVMVFSGKHRSSSATSTVSARIYSENPATKSPGSTVGTTAVKALNTFTGSDVLTFPTPVIVPAGNFFASIESPSLGGASQDTLAILSTKEGCSSPDSLSWEYSQIVGSGGYWSSVVSGKPSQNLDILIFPVVEIGPSTVGINRFSKNDLTLLAAFPNPAMREVNINFSLSSASHVEITLYDMIGNEISSFKTDELPAGNHSKAIDVSALSAGTYLYRISSNNAQLMSKLNVIK